MEVERPRRPVPKKRLRNRNRSLSPPPEPPIDLVNPDLRKTRFDELEKPQYSRAGADTLEGSDFGSEPTALEQDRNPTCANTAGTTDVEKPESSGNAEERHADSKGSSENQDVKPSNGFKVERSEEILARLREKSSKVSTNAFEQCKERVYPEITKSLVQSSEKNLEVFDEMTKPAVVPLREKMKKEIPIAQSKTRVYPPLPDVAVEDATVMSFFPELESFCDKYLTRFLAEESPSTRTQRHCTSRLYMLIDEYLASVSASATVAEEFSVKEARISELGDVVWEMRKCKDQVNGICPANHPASGTATYMRAEFNQSRFAELQRVMTEVRTSASEAVLKSETEKGVARTLCVAFVNYLIYRGARDLSYEEELRNALRTCFHFLRQPESDPIREHLQNWATQLSACLLTYYHAKKLDTQLWLLNHLLRLPPGRNNWSAPLFQPQPVQNESTLLNSQQVQQSARHFLIYLWFLARPVPERQAFLAPYVRQAAALEHDEWQVVSPAGEELDAAALKHAAESDLLALVGQAQFEQIASNIFGMLETSTIADLHTAVRFVNQTCQLLTGSFASYAPTELSKSGNTHVDFMKQMAYIVRALLRIMTKHLDTVMAHMRTHGIGTPQELAGVGAARNACMLEAVSRIVTQRIPCVQQCLADLPYESLSGEAKTLAALGDLIGQDLDLDNQSVTYRLTALATIAKAAQGEEGECVARKVLKSIFATCFRAMDNCDDLIVKTGCDLVLMITESKPNMISVVIELFTESRRKSISPELRKNQDECMAELFSEPLPFDRWLPTIANIECLGSWLLCDLFSVENKVSRKVISRLRSGRLPIRVAVSISLHVMEARWQHALIIQSMSKESQSQEVTTEFASFDMFAWAVIASLYHESSLWRLTEAENSRLAKLLAAKDKVAIFFALCINVETRSMQNIQGFGDLAPLLNELLSMGNFVQAIFVIQRWTRAHADLTVSEGFLSVVFDILTRDNRVPLKPKKGRKKSSKKMTYLPEKRWPRTIFTSMIVNDLMSQSGIDSLETRAVFWIKTITSSKLAKPDFAWAEAKEHAVVMNAIVQTALHLEVSLDFLVAHFLQEIALQVATARQEASSHERQGIASWILGPGHRPSLNTISESIMATAPVFSFVWLLAEAKALQPLQAAFENEMRTGQVLNVPEVVAKLKLPGKTLSCLPFYRWLSYCTSVPASEPFLILGVQQMYLYMFERTPKRTPFAKKPSGTTYVTYRSRYIHGPEFTKRQELLLRTLDSMRDWYHLSAERSPDNQQLRQLAALAKDFNSWLSDPTIGSSYRLDVAISYKYESGERLNELLSGETTPWLSLLPLAQLEEEISELAAIFHPDRRAAGSRDASTPSLDRAESFALLEGVRRQSTKVNTGLPLPQVQLFPLDPEMPFLYEPMSFGELEKVLNAAIFGVENGVVRYGDVLAEWATYDLAYEDGLGRLYKNVNKELRVDLVCKQGYVQKCGAKGAKTVTVQAALKLEMIERELETNRDMLEDRVRSKLKSIEIDLTGHAAVFRALVVVYFGVIARRESELGTKLYYRLVYDFAKNSRINKLDFTKNFLLKSISDLGKLFVANTPAQVYPVFQVILHHPDFAVILMENFTPDCADSGTIEAILDDLHAAAMPEKLPGNILKCILEKLPIRPTQDSFKVAVTCCKLVLASSKYATERGNLEKLLLELFRESVEINGIFPALLQELLRFSGTFQISPAVWRVTEEKLTKYRPDPDLAVRICLAYGTYFAHERKNGTVLYEKYLQYLEILLEIQTKMMSWDFRVGPGHSFSDGYWDSLAFVYAPWIRAGQSEPWPAKFKGWAERFLADWLKFTTAPRSDLVENLGKIFQFCYECTAANSPHCSEVYVKYFCRLPWGDFLTGPSEFVKLLDILRNRTTPYHIWATTMMVKVPWAKVFESLNEVHEDAMANPGGMMGVLLEILVRCSVTEGNMVDCKVSFPKLLTDFAKLDWSIVSDTTYDLFPPLFADKVWLVESAPPEFDLFYQSAFCIAPASGRYDAGAMACKQAVYIRAMLPLILRVSEPVAFNRDLLEVLATSYKMMQQVNDLMVREYVILFNSFSNPQLIREILSSTAGELAKGQFPPEILLSLISSVTSHVKTTEFVVTLTEACATGFFEGRKTVAFLGDLAAAVKFASPGAQSVFQEEARRQNALFCVLMCGEMVTRLQNLEAELKFVQTVLEEVLTSVAREAQIEPEQKIFPLLAQFLFLAKRQLEFGGITSPVSNLIKDFLGILSKLSTGDNSWLGSVWSKSPTYSIQFRLICGLLLAFLNQHVTLEKKVCKIRLTPSDAVAVNNTMQSVQQLRQMKGAQPFWPLVDSSANFFGTPTHHFGTSVAFLTHLVSGERYGHVVKEFER